MADTAGQQEHVTETREQIVHSLYEAAELEHDLMCTYLYACFSLKSGVEEGLLPAEAAAVARWRKAILDVAIDEMGHLSAVWNITAALGGIPRFGRGNFPLDVGSLPAGIVVKLAPFNADVLQHFIYLERPGDSTEPEGKGFEPPPSFRRGTPLKLTPMALDYDTVGVFYEKLGASLRGFSARVGEKVAFAGDPALQLGPAEIDLGGAKPVLCLKTALQAFEAIVTEGEGASSAAEHSHFNRFRAVREEYLQLKAANPNFQPAWPAATNPVLRRPPTPEGKVWLEDPEAQATVDLGNAVYQLMLRLLGYSYGIRRPHPEKGLAIDLGISLMRAVSLLGERAARLPAGPSNPHCNAGLSFTALRDAAPLAQGEAARRFFIERLEEFSAAAEQLAANGDARVENAARILATLREKAVAGFASAAEAEQPKPESKKTRLAIGSEPTTKVDGIETVEGQDVTVIYEGRKCIHSRFCVTWTPTVFLANVEGPWIHPDTVDADKVVEVAEVCPSGAIRYKRKDGKPDEVAPPVNLAGLREGGPYGFRGDLLIDGKPAGFRATLCRCGASKNKPFCDGSHHDIGFDASGEPATLADKSKMLEVRNGPIHIDPEINGPLKVRGNLEITAGTGRMVARIQSARLCRCGHSATKPFCDNSHVRVGFKS
jgi:CDGSH-type Zn-finger protein/uncharacterized Fe-S cluster protein YjdI